MTRRRVWLLVHRVNGLLLAGFLITVGLTGAALAWKLPLERLFAPRLFQLAPHAVDAPRLDPLAVRENVAAAFPWADVDVADLSRAPDVPLEFSLAPRADASGAPLDDDAFADPYTGRVLGARHYGDVRQGAVNTVPLLYNLHQFLALGRPGEICLGFVALLWTFDCFVGLYLTFPASHRSLTPSPVTRLAQWPGRFVPSWTIRFRQSGFRRLYDLHRATGLWLWLLLLLFAWTGVAFNLPSVYAPVMRVFGASKELQQQPAACPVLPQKSPVWNVALLQSRQLMAEHLRQRHAVLQYERFLSYDRSSCAWTYRVHSTLDIDHIGNTQITWSLASPRAASFRSPVGVTRTDAFTTWMEAIHEGQVGGAPLRLLITSTGVVTAWLSLSGILLFRRKLARR